MLQRQVVNREGTRRYRCPVQSKFAVTRPPPEEPTVRTDTDRGYPRVTRRLRAGLNYSCLLCLRRLAQTLFSRA